MELLAIFLLLSFAANTILARPKKATTSTKPKASMSDLYNKDDMAEHVTQ